MVPLHVFLRQRRTPTFKVVSNVKIQSSTSTNRHQIYVYNIMMSPTSMSPFNTLYSEYILGKISIIKIHFLNAVRDTCPKLNLKKILKTIWKSYEFNKSRILKKMISVNQNPVKWKWPSPNVVNLTCLSRLSIFTE